MRVALYLRRSTNEELQADSLRVQKAQLEEYAKIHGHIVVGVYEDSASGLSVKGREGFLRLIDRVKRGAPFEAILVQNVSRWGRFSNTDESAFYEFLALTHGVEVIYINETFGAADSPIAPLLKSAKRWMAAEFSREKSRTVRRSQARVVKLGFMHGGPPPFGMKRILVRLDGSFLADLLPGDHKALSNLRVKLAPGDPAETAVVRRIFAMYAGESSLMDIAAALNAEGVRGKAGGRWSSSGVAYLLRNEVYAGVAKYTVTEGRSRSDIRNILDDESDDCVIRTPASFARVIDEKTWDAVQLRLKSQTWRKTDLDLARELRAAFERWGHVEANMLDAVTDSADWKTYKNRFRRGYVEALESAYEDEVNAAKTSLRALLETRFMVKDFEEGWLIDDLLYVSFKYAWPRANRAGLIWSFQFTGEEAEDVTIGFGFSPPPVVRAVSTFYFQTSRFKVRKRSVGRALSTLRSPTRFALPKTAEETIRYVQTAIYFRNARAEKNLLEAVKDLPLVTLAKLARGLGWPLNATRLIYLKLLARGAPVPPLRGKHGRRIEVVCPSCSSVRRLSVSDAMRLRTDLCFECVNRRPSTKLPVTCPRCGAVRHYFASQVKALSLGAASPCRRCGPQFSPSVVAALTDWRMLQSQKRDVMRRVADQVVAYMCSEPTIYLHAAVWVRKGQTSTIRWKDPQTSASLRLTLDCEDADICAIDARPADAGMVQETLDRSRWQPVRCDKRHAGAWSVRVLP
jgi:DNA invertase Pin-like site-specific DNA recombinase